MVRKDSVQIEVDEASLANLNKQFAALGTTIETASHKSIFKVLTQIQTEAKLRIKGRKHIVTGRLWNSIHVKMKKYFNTQTNPEIYKDDEGNVYKSDLSTVKLSNDFEGAVGTNVEYAGKIEFLDSYLYWAMKNVDIEKKVKDAMSEDLKYKL